MCSASRFTPPLTETIELNEGASSVIFSSVMRMRSNLTNVDYSMSGRQDAPRMEQAASHSHCLIDLSVLLGIGFLKQQGQFDARVIVCRNGEWGKRGRLVKDQIWPDSIH